MICLNIFVTAQQYSSDYESRYSRGPLLDSIGNVYSIITTDSTNSEDGYYPRYQKVTNLLSGKQIDSIYSIEPISRYYGTEKINKKNEEEIPNNIFYGTGNYIIKRNQKVLVVDIKFNILLYDIFDSYEFIEWRNVYLVKKNGKFGILSPSAELRLKPDFDQIININYRNSDEYNSINYVKKDELLGIADSNYILRIPPIYSKITNSFKKNRLIAIKNDTCSIINLDNFSTHGKVKNNDLSEIAHNAKGYKMSFFKIQYGDFVGLLDSNLNLISDTNFNSIESLPNTNYFKVGKARKWAFMDLNYSYGLIDDKNKLCISCDYDDISSFENDFFKVIKNKRIGVVDPNFKEVISPQLFEMSSLGSKYFAFKSGEFWGIISSTGQILKEPIFESIQLLYESKDCSMSYIAFRLKSQELTGIMDEQLKVIVEPKYQGLSPLTNTVGECNYQYPYFVVKYNESESVYGLIDLSFKQILKAEYGQINSTDDEKIWRVYKGKYFLINEKEEFVRDDE